MPVVMGPNEPFRFNNLLHTKRQLQRVRELHTGFGMHYWHPRRDTSHVYLFFSLCTHYFRMVELEQHKRRFVQSTTQCHSAATEYLI